MRRVYEDFILRFSRKEKCHWRKEPRLICRQFGVKRVYQSEAERSIEGRRSSKNHTERIKRSRHQSESKLTGRQSGGAFALDRAGSGRHSRAVMSGRSEERRVGKECRTRWAT